MSRYFAIMLLSLLGACSSAEKGEQALSDVSLDIHVDSTIPDNGEGKNSPPRLHKIGNKEVKVAETLELLLKADDDDGDTLTYSVYGDLPEGSKFFKPEGRFTWTPEEKAGPFFITFVVSDLTDFDSETVELRAVNDKTQHPPTFEQLGDQILQPGVLYQLQLEASDEDGDTLRYATLGPIPDGASLDGATGLFRWTPEQNNAGSINRVTFQVTDGALTDTLEARLIVAGGELDNNPPTVEPLDSMEVSVGNTLEFDILATDPDQDPLTITVSGALPQGAQFNAETWHFKWTPTAAQAGKSIHLLFEISDSVYVVKLAADIWVRTASQACGDDEFEPNNDLQSATLLTQGSFPNLSICDTETSPVDSDWFRLMLEPGEKLQAHIEFVHEQGDLELALFAEGSEEPLVHNPSVANSESVTYQTTAAGNYYLVVFGVGSGVFSSGYAMTIERSTGNIDSCQPDSLEPNNASGDATVVPANKLDGTPISNLTICAGDLDYYNVELSCGDTLYAATSFSHSTGDLDMLLLGPDGETVDSSLSSLDNETVGVEAASLAGDYLVVVSGYPEDSTENQYSIEFLVEEGAICEDDPQEPDNSPSTATTISQSLDLMDLSLCCSKDWFRFPAGVGTVVVEMVYPDTSDIQTAFYLESAMNDAIPLSCSEGLCQGSINVPNNVDAYLSVGGPNGLQYAMTATIESATTDSCAGHCDESAGSCWCDEGCAQYGDCCGDICETCGYCAS